MTQPTLSLLSVPPEKPGTPEPESLLMSQSTQGRHSFVPYLPESRSNRTLAGDVRLVHALDLDGLRPNVRETGLLALRVRTGDAEEQVAAVRGHGRRLRLQDGGRDGREERCHEDAENGNDHEQLDERETVCFLFHL